MFCLIGCARARLLREHYTPAGDSFNLSGCRRNNWGN